MSVSIRACIVAILSASALFADQKPLTPSSPASVGPPVWSRSVPMPDGRTFVTDGGMAIDASVARPSTMPAAVLGPQSGVLLSRHFAAQFDDEVGFRDLGPGPFKNTFATPKGIAVNGNYVDYLRGLAPAHRLRLRVKGAMDPIVVLLDKKPIAVLMPVRR